MFEARCTILITWRITVLLERLVFHTPVKDPECQDMPDFILELGVLGAQGRRIHVHTHPLLCITAALGSTSVVIDASASLPGRVLPEEFRR
jgi:hypothetical protein